MGKTALPELNEQPDDRAEDGPDRFTAMGARISMVATGARHEVVRDPSLDGIRFLAAMWVLLTHASYNGISIIPFINFHGAGRVAVLVFFFLSAFSLATPFFRHRDQLFRWQTWVAYVVRRALRILPLYYLVLLVECVASVGIFGDSRVESRWSLLVGHVTFREALSVFWTIAVELRFYVVLPFLVIGVGAVFLRFRLGVFALLAIVIAWTASRSVLPPVAATLGIDANAPVFVWGIAAAAIVSRDWRFSRRWRTVLEILAWSLGVACIYLLVPAYHPLQPGTALADYNETSAVYEIFWRARTPWVGPLLATLFFAYAHGRGAMRAMLSWPAFSTPGAAAYGIYLLHAPIVEYFARMPWPVPVRLLAILSASIAAALVLYRGVDPCMKLGRLVSNRILALGKPNGLSR